MQSHQPSTHTPSLESIHVPMRSLEGHASTVRALAVLPDGALVSGSSDKTIKLWDQNGRCVRTLQGHTNSVYALAVLPDGTLVSGSWDNTIKLWDKNGRCTQILEATVLKKLFHAVFSCSKDIHLWVVSRLERFEDLAHFRGKARYSGH